LSPYIFFSQEKRKQIKKESNISAKMIMKQVSKCWQEIKNDSSQTEKYEYLSLRDREAYAILQKFCHEHKNQLAPADGEEMAHVSLRSHDHISFQAEVASANRMAQEHSAQDRTGVMPAILEVT
jgi:hypothetical protein